MMVRFEHVRRPHFLLKAKAPQHLPLTWVFWEHLIPASKGIVVWCACDTCWEHPYAAELIGFLRYAGTRNLSELGTWVHPDFRREGIAMDLWDDLVRVESPRSIHATTVTKPGKKFLATLRKRHPAIKWHVKDKT